MSDQEMLEMAARAGDIKIDQTFSYEYPPTSLPNGYLVIINASGGHSFWNPLADDGDAMRLAMKLRIDLEWQDDGGIEAYQLTDNPHFCAAEEPTMGYSVEEATRRAIVRVAAHAGRTTK